MELLVPLTWPIEQNELQITANHYRHTPYLQLAQISYKREILEHWSSSILRAAVRVGLLSIALPIRERTQRDEGIIKLLLYFLRNTVIISAPAGLPVEWNENEVSRSATIDAFQNQDVLALLLTIASNMGDDFNTQDIIVLEVLFHLVKGVNVEKLFMDEVQLQAKDSNDLRGLMAKEAVMLKGYKKNAPTRHSRFGTMIWVKRDDERVSTVSGQDVLVNGQHTLSKMDQSKKWNRPKQRKKEERTHNNFDVSITLTKSAKENLRNFVEEFLDSGFNPLFTHIRRAIEREAERILEVHAHQYFYLIGWFLEAERLRRLNKGNQNQHKDSELSSLEAESFGLVAGVLNQETFVLLNRFMQDRLDHKLWHEVDAGMRSFTQILLTVQTMAESKLDEDQEIAENIQNRIFYEETTHDQIVAILRGYKDQGFSYLDACTELSHIFLRMLERYSKENMDLQIRSRRRARKKQKEEHQTEDAQDTVADQDSEAEDMIEAQRVSRERKFDFNRFAAKFLTQPCVNTFATFTSFFQDLSKEQLKRAHRFFYRVAFKQEMSVVLFRIDIIALFNKIVKGPEGISAANPMFRDWDELVKQLFRRLVKKMQSRPELATELLFSKINSTTFYLEYGYEKQTISSKPRPPAGLEIKGNMTKEEQIGVIVAVLYEEKMDYIDFVKNVLDSAANERQSWEAETEARRLLQTTNNSDMEPGSEHQPEEPRSPAISKHQNETAQIITNSFLVVKPDNEERRIAMFKDNKLRLLMSLAGFERIGEVDDIDASWIIPSSLTSAALRETAAWIAKHRMDPITQYGEEGSVQAEELLRRKAAPRPPRAEFDDDSEGLGDLGEEVFLFPAGGPTARKSTALDELKKRRRKRRRSITEDDDGLDEEAIAARRKARLVADIEKRRKIKSTEFVHESDDADDEDGDREFFANEGARRRGQASEISRALHAESVHDASSKKRKRKETDSRRQKKTKSSDTESSDASSGDEAGPFVEDDLIISGGSSSPAPRIEIGSSEDEASETPLSSQTDLQMAPDELPKSCFEQATESASALDKEVGVGLNGGEDDEDSDTIPQAPRSTQDRQRGRTRLMVLDDSDDE